MASNLKEWLILKPLTDNQPVEKRKKAKLLIFYEGVIAILA